jgi:hypothetical protein
MFDLFFANFNNNNNNNNASYGVGRSVSNFRV